MQTMVLDFSGMATPGQVQEYLAGEFGFPDYYGRNLDALHDMLTELMEDVCVHIKMPEAKQEQDIHRYLWRVCQVMLDAEDENPHLKVAVERVTGSGFGQETLED